MLNPVLWYLERIYEQSWNYLDMSEVQHWLKPADLQEYTDLFVKNKIGFNILPDLYKKDLECLGNPLGDRKRILKAIAGLCGYELPF